MSGATGDKYSNAALRENLKVGVTTPEEVRAIYGKPDYTSEGPSGPSYWSYDVDEDTNALISTAASFIPFSSAVADQAQQRRSLDIYFENHRVRSYSLSNSKPR